MAARREYEVAGLAAAAKPDDSVSSETLHRARENLKSSSRRASHVKAEVNYVAFLHDVVLAF